ncbi:hypothetical protein DFP74_1697 [Nocardiopsis sp. Huas11]|uniref:hypothetical protein n=1 Tax=Nocardiopsis sp. Huas11 TaxID=2183912 RepID=UPI000F0E2E42|nr:hypothetical protein [Nocardiopsis sp. Huas11]RKS06074.1 hypothetical protein DFP74_1697 [Nocardiopsis sp. Huas11]
MDDLYQRFLTRTRGTPYTVSPIQGGLRLHLDVADVTWQRLFHQMRMSREYSINLRVDPARRTYSREQVVRSMRWVDGVGMTPRVQFSDGAGQGTRKEIHLGRRRRTPSAHGYHVDFRELAELVDEVMLADGWTRTMDRSSRIGLIAAGIGVGAALLGVAAALIAVLA